jgi:hypothetical protein
MRGCERRKNDDVVEGESWHIMRGKVGEGGYNIMDEQVFQNTFKSTTPMVDGGRIIKKW